MTDLVGTRVRRLLEDQEMGDRTPSQFYKDLKKLTATSISHDFVLTLWKNRLPVNMQRIPAAIRETSPNALSMVAERIHEISPEQPGQAATASEQSDRPSATEPDWVS